MSEVNKYRIQRFRKNILADIQEDVIEELQKVNVLTRSDMDSINKKDNFKEKMEHFLDLILQKSPSDVEHFIMSLKIWYRWLYDLINNYKSNIHSIKLHDDLIRGGVPPLPHRNITRTELLERVRNKLCDLERNHYLVIHGMLGCGKTSLATEAVNNEMIRNVCKGQIFWIPVGSEGEKTILSLQECLNAILPDPELSLSDDVNVSLIRLQRRFSEWDKGKDALIILDDVHSDKVINYLSVGTKFLITTEDEYVISSQRRSVATFEKIPDGFEEIETLSLLSSAIGVKTHELPSQAKLIHKYCKGHPMIISLISAQLEDHKEQAISVTSRWDHYVELFSNKDLKRRSFDESQSINNAIKSAIESLSQEKKEYFEHFVLFVEEVNIRPEVLAIIWSMSKHEVENIVMEFVRKSLVVRKWNAHMKSYVYGVHYLILRYLTINIQKDQVQLLHQNLVNKYLEVCNNNLSQLKVGDNYIYYYIGRHLKLAKMFDWFPILYFNLEFIEMKLKKAGPADMIVDFKRYREQICGFEHEILNTKKLSSFLQFVELYGSWVSKGLDIAQLALQEHPDTYIYKCGYELAKKRSKFKPFILFPLGPHNKKRIVPQMVDIKKPISAICFTESPYFVLIGFSLGSIELWDLRSKAVQRKFNEHNGYILQMKVNLISNKFLSTSTDGSTRIWELPKEPLSGDRTPSPRERQDCYSELWPTGVENIGEKSLLILEHEGPVIWASFPHSESSEVIATISHRFQVSVWKESILSWSIEERGAKTCEICHEDQWVVVGGENRVAIFYINIPNLIYSFNWNVKLLYSIPDNLGGGLLMVSDDRIDVWGLKNENPIIVPSEICYDEKYICCAVSYHIALGTDKSNVKICHRHTGKTLRRFRESQIGAKLVALSLNESALVTAFDDKTLFLWPLDDYVLPISTISWPLCAETPLVARVTTPSLDKEKKNNSSFLQIFKGRKLMREFSVEGEILSISLSADGNTVAFTKSHTPTIQINSSDLKDTIECSIELENLTNSKVYLFTYEGQAIVAAHSKNSRIHVWYQKTNELIILGQESANCKFISMASKGQLSLLTVSSMYGVRIWSLNGGGNILKTLTLSRIKKSGLCFISQNKETIAIAESTTIQLFREKNNLSPLKEFADIVYCTLSPDGRILAFALKNFTLVVYNIISTERREYPFQRKCYKDLIMAVSNDGILCVATSETLVAMYTNLGASYIVLQASSIISSPNSPDKFAVLDNCGELHVLQISNDDIILNNQ